MTMSTVTFTVYGRPQPQGSMKAFIPKGWKRPVLTSDNKNLKSWRQEVSVTASRAMKGMELATRPSPVSLDATFFVRRPKSTPKGREHPTTRPDLSKLVRALEDALTGICYEDDAEIVYLAARKLYGDPERTQVRVSWE